jgi:hypothetical protein
LSAVCLCDVAHSGISPCDKLAHRRGRAGASSSIRSMCSRTGRGALPCVRGAPALRAMQERMHAAPIIVGGRYLTETTMKMKSISLAAALALASTTALAQGNAATAGNDTNNSTTAGGAAVKNGTTGTTTGSSRPSPKDASTQGAGTAGAVDRKGDATSPGGTMKK